jgi:hypothetical protein
MGAAGVHGDVAGDGAGELARRVRRVEEALVRDRGRDGEVGDPGFDPGGPVLEIHVEDARHLRDADHDRVLLRDRASGERGAGAPRHDLDALLVAEAEHRCDLGGRGRQDDRQRNPPVGCEAVGLEGPPFVKARDERLGRYELGEAREDLIPLGENTGVGFGKGDGHEGTGRRG